MSDAVIITEAENRQVVEADAGTQVVEQVLTTGGGTVDQSARDQIAALDGRVAVLEEGGGGGAEVGPWLEIGTDIAYAQAAPAETWVWTDVNPDAPWSGLFQIGLSNFGRADVKMDTYGSLFTDPASDAPAYTLPTEYRPTTPLESYGVVIGTDGVIAPVSPVSSLTRYSDPWDVDPVTPPSIPTGKPNEYGLHDARVRLEGDVVRLSGVFVLTDAFYGSNAVPMFSLPEDMRPDVLTMLMWGMVRIDPDGVVSLASGQVEGGMAVLEGLSFVVGG